MTNFPDMLLSNCEHSADISDNRGLHCDFLGVLVPRAPGAFEFMRTIRIGLVLSDVGKPHPDECEDWLCQCRLEESDLGCRSTLSLMRFVETSFGGVGSRCEVSLSKSAFVKALSLKLGNGSSSSELSIIGNCNAASFADLCWLVALGGDGVALRRKFELMIDRDWRATGWLARRVGRGNYWKCCRLRPYNNSSCAHETNLHSRRIVAEAGAVFERVFVAADWLGNATRHNSTNS